MKLMALLLLFLVAVDAQYFKPIFQGLHVSTDKRIILKRKTTKRYRI